MTEPLVSIILPAYNVADYVAEAVMSAHTQDWPRIELICIDDGSTDGTAAVLHRCADIWTTPDRVMQIVSQTNQGAASARNRGLEEAQGAFICFLDGDDVMQPKLITSMVDILRSDPSVQLAAPSLRYVDATGAPIGITSHHRKRRFNAQTLVVDGPIQSATGVTTTADAARRAGPFDTALRGCIDLDWFVRLLAETGGVAQIAPDLLADYRKRPDQITSEWRRMRENWEVVVAKMARAGHDLSPVQTRSARARNNIFWATVAYQSGEFSQARRLVWQAWRHAPGQTLRDAHARIRTLAVLASLLPASVHLALQRRAAGQMLRSKQ
ncbi:MAG: glycosyltransferase family 2 protein [Pseudomonadota bacterium]